jgi:hypothetical protein
VTNLEKATLLVSVSSIEPPVPTLLGVVLFLASAVNTKANVLIGSIKMGKYQVGSLKSTVALAQELTVKVFVSSARI